MENSLLVEYKYMKVGLNTESCSFFHYNFFVINGKTSFSYFAIARDK